MKNLDGEVFAYLSREFKLTVEEKKKIGAMIYRRCRGWNTFNLACVLYVHSRKNEFRDWITFAAAALSNKVSALSEFEKWEVRAKQILAELSLKVNTFER